MKHEQAEQFPPMRVMLKNENAVIVRLLREDDADALGDLYESVPPEDSRFYLSPSELNRSRASAEAGQANSPFFVGLAMEAADGKIAGYAYYRWIDENAPVSSFGVCIRKEYQGSGAGKALMAHILDIASKIGPPVMGLTVQKANERAVILYQKMGFDIVREQTRAARDGFAEEPEYYMESRVQ